MGTAASPSRTPGAAAIVHLGADVRWCLPKPGRSLQARMPPSPPAAAAGLVEPASAPAPTAVAPTERGPAAAGGGGSGSVCPLLIPPWAAALPGPAAGAAVEMDAPEIGKAWPQTAGCTGRPG